MLYYGVIQQNISNQLLVDYETVANDADFYYFKVNYENNDSNSNNQYEPIDNYKMIKIKGPIYKLKNKRANSPIYGNLSVSESSAQKPAESSVYGNGPTYTSTLTAPHVTTYGDAKPVQKKSEYANMQISPGNSSGNSSGHSSGHSSVTTVTTNGEPQETSFGGYHNIKYKKSKSKLKSKHNKTNSHRGKTKRSHRK